MPPGTGCTSDLASEYLVTLTTHKSAPDHNNNSNTNSEQNSYDNISRTNPSPCTGSNFCTWRLTSY